MKLYFYRSPSGVRNFGDELNLWLWPQAIGEYIDDSEDILFVGIGTLLDHKIPESPKKIVFGSGCGYGTNARIDSRYRIYCVRGPLTARALGIDEKLAITDAALLVTDYYEASTNSETGMAYMPHWNMHSIELQTICRDLGIRYVDPTNPDIITTLDEIACSTTLITEAMHGAILADSYGVPWIPVKTTPEILDMKWHDWCATVDIDYAPNRVTPIWDMPQDKSHIRKAKQAIKRIMIKHELQSLVKHGSRMLSSPVVRNNNMRRLKSALELLTTDLRSGYS